MTIYEEIKQWVAYNPFDFVEPCEPDCTPERHAYHQGQWDMAVRICRHFETSYPNPVDGDEIPTKATQAILDLVVEWRPVLGYEGLYEVSNFGDVRSIKRQGTSGSTLSSRPINCGYLGLVLYKGDVAKNALVHRLVAQAFIPNPDNKPQVNHKDFDKCNNSVRNLEWATPKENTVHAHTNGHAPKPPRGETNGGAKLTEEDVRDIKLFLKAGVKRTDIARLYPVGRTSIAAIANGLKWRHV